MILTNTWTKSPPFPRSSQFLFWPKCIAVDLHRGSICPSALAEPLAWDTCLVRFIQKETRRWCAGCGYPVDYQSCMYYWKSLGKRYQPWDSACFVGQFTKHRQARYGSTHRAHFKIGNSCTLPRAVDCPGEEIITIQLQMTFLVPREFTTELFMLKSGKCQGNAWKCLENRALSMSCCLLVAVGSICPFKLWRCNDTELIRNSRQPAFLSRA